MYYEGMTTDAASLHTFLAAHIHESPAVLALRDVARAHHIPVVTEEVGAFLQLLVRLHQPTQILELGTAIGVSGTLMLEAAPKDARFTGVELTSERYTIAKQQFQDNDRVNIIHGDFREDHFFDRLTAPYDFIFLDAAKGQYPFLLETLLPIATDGAVFVFADVFMHGWVLTGNYPNRRQKTAVLRLQTFLKDLSQDSRLHTTLLPLDEGIAVAIKKSAANSHENIVCHQHSEYK